MEEFVSPIAIVDFGSVGVVFGVIDRDKELNRSNVKAIEDAIEIYGRD